MAVQRRRRRVLVALAPLVAVLASAISCATSETTWSGSPTGRRVVVIGDSITFLSAGQIHDALDPTYRVAVTGIVGATSRLEVHGTPMSEFEAAAAMRPDIVVVNLGTNDFDLTAADTLFDLATISTMFGPSICFVPVTISTHGEGEFAPSSEHARSLNPFLATEHGADWARAVDADPTLVDTDGVHPTGKGSVELARLYREAVDECPR